MIAAALLVLAANMGLALASPRLVSGLAPSTACRVLAGAGALATAAGVATVAILSLDTIAQIPFVATRAQWSAVDLSRSAHVPALVGAACLALLATILVRCSRVLLEHVRALVASDRLRAGRRSPQSLVVIEDSHPDAYAEPGWRGRVVITTAMLDVLPADERRVVVAHEYSHLRHRHWAYLSIGRLAAAANPLLRGLPTLLGTAIERWADEDAAADSGDRLLTARALARAGLASRRSAGTVRPSTVLSIADGGPVTARATAMLHPAPRSRPSRAVAAAALTVVALVGTLALARSTEHRFEVAHATYEQLDADG